MQIKTSDVSSAKEVGAAVKSFTELQMWQFVRCRLGDERRKQLVDMLIAANETDVMTNAQRFLDRLEILAIETAAKRG